MYRSRIRNMSLKSSVIRRKSCLYYVLVILLFFNFLLLAYFYFFFLKEFNRDHIRTVSTIRREDEPNLPERQPPVASNINTKGRQFVIDYKNNVFLKDGQPFQYISGSLHYFRVPRVYWRDRLRKFRAAGLNVVCTYVEWNSHEPTPGNYKFTGEEDIEYFIQLAIEEDLLVILRPGPYVCAERDFGGLPPWLLTLYPNINLRTSDPAYQKEVQKWFALLLPKMTKYLYGNGGPIIMVQIENEYGSYGAHDEAHKIWLRDLMKSYVQDNAVLFTTDGNADHYLRYGTIQDVYATVDFGTTANVSESFTAMRAYSPRGPLVNSEFYPGWLSHWAEPFETVTTDLILRTMRDMLAVNASFNFYMFYGGTNFGFTNGANLDDSMYRPQLTSYDYDAPLDEAGDPTPKYYAIRNLIAEYFKIPNIPLPKPEAKGHYGEVTLKPVLSLFNHERIPDAVTRTSLYPKTFEELGLAFGYVLYETKIPSNISDPITLYAHGVRDRAVVYVDRNPVTILDRSRNVFSAPLFAPPGKTLSLLVENQGRINFGDYLKDFKGMLSTPTLGNTRLITWTMTLLPFNDVSWAHNLPSNSNVQSPGIYTGEFELASGEEPLDTYVDTTGWGKGIIFVNNFNLGRYWPSIGSQVTLYVPAIHLNAGPKKNHIVIFETEYAPSSLKVVFKNKPYLNKIPPEMLWSSSSST